MKVTDCIIDFCRSHCTVQWQCNLFLCS